MKCLAKLNELYFRTNQQIENIIQGSLAGEEIICFRLPVGKDTLRIKFDKEANDVA